MRVTNHVYILSGGHYAAVDDQSMLGEVYGIHTHQGVILIDCGVPGAGLSMIKETLSYYDIHKKITHLILTHAHWDHCGNAKEIQDMGAEVIIGEEDAFQCTNGGVRGLDSPFEYQHVYEPFTPDIRIREDSKLELNGLTFSFIKTPGHTPGSMVVQVDIDGKTITFSGDVVQPNGRFLETVELGWQGDLNFDRKAVVESMLKLSHYQTDMILPGHGKVCLRNGTRLFQLSAQTAFLTMR